MAETDNDQAVADYIAFQVAQEQDQQLMDQLSRSKAAAPKEYHQRVDPKTGMKFNVEKTMDWQPEAAPVEQAVAAPAAGRVGSQPVVDGNGNLLSTNEMVAVRDPTKMKHWVAPQEEADILKKSKVTVEGAIPDDPAQAQWRSDSTAAKLGIADQEADIAIQQNAEKQRALEQAAAQQQLAMQDQAAKLAQREAIVDKSMAELDATIQQHAQQWQRGTSTGSELFDGSFGAGNMLSVIGITLAGMGGPDYQRNAMDMVNKSLDRAIESQRFAIGSMFKQLENKTGSAEIARESMKMMQLKYAETMADLYATKNLTPQIAINLARLKVDLTDQYMAAEAKVRELTIGKVKTEQDFVHQQAVQGHWANYSLDDQLKILKIDQNKIKNVGESLEVIGADGKPQKMQPGDATAIKQAAEYDGALTLLDRALVAAGGRLGADGHVDPESLRNVDLKGVGLSKFLFGVFTPDEVHDVRNQLRQAISSGSAARRTGQVSDATVRRDESMALGGVWEGQQVNSVINYMETLKKERDARLNAVSPQARARYQGTLRQSAEQTKQSLGDAGLNMREVQ